MIRWHGITIQKSWTAGFGRKDLSPICTTKQKIIATPRSSSRSDLGFRAGGMLVTTLAKKPFECRKHSHTKT